MVCNRMAQELTSLRSLHITEVIEGGDIQVDDPWSAPYFHFCSSQSAGNINVKVSVLKGDIDLDPYFVYWMCFATDLKDVSTELERRIKENDTVPRKEVKETDWCC